MKRTRIGIVVLGLGVAVAWAAAPPAGAQGQQKSQQQTLKQMMGENFAGLQAILAALITSNYTAVPEQVAVIQEHADHLTQNVPASIGGDRTRFLSYAYNLRTNAEDLESIVQALMQHDAGKTHLATDELREAAAAHYGGMVTMCVACHNRYRPNVVR